MNTKDPLCTFCNSPLKLLSASTGFWQCPKCLRNYQSDSDITWYSNKKPKPPPVKRKSPSPVSDEAYSIDNIDDLLDNL